MTVVQPTYEESPELGVVVDSRFITAHLLVVMII